MADEEFRVGQPPAEGANLAATESQPSPRPRGSMLPGSGLIVDPERFRYDPDKDCRPEDFNVPVTDYFRRFALIPSDPTESDKITVPGHGTFIPQEVEGTFLEPVKESKRWKATEIKSAKELKQFHESAAGKLKRTMESFGGSDFSDTIDATTPFLNPTRLIDRTDFVPLMWGPFYKQLYIYDYLFMHARAFQLVNHNALAAAAVKILTRFVLGRGISFLIKHPRAEAVWNEFWERNNMDKQIRQCARDLTWQGEIMWRIYEDPHNKGFLTIRLVDPSSCWEIVTDPEDVDRIYYFHFQWPTPYQIWTTGKIPVTKYVVAQIPPTNILFTKMNVSAQERRGRSDFLPAMPWMKRFENFYDGATVKAMLEANLVWKIKVSGDQADVDAILNSPQVTELPPPGGTWIENDAVTLTPMSAQLTAGARGAQGIGQQIASIVATTLNLPAEYFNIETPTAARATALVRTDPAVKSIEDRQQLLREIIEGIYDRVMQAALEAGRISKEDAREDPDAVSPGQETELTKLR